MMIRPLCILKITSIVHVFPPPVCPYAKIVPLKPPITDLITGTATSL